MSPGNKPRYGDFHFHTGYSDNRDKASLSEMAARGVELGITCFGTGDHNHNLSLVKWQKQQEETVAFAAEHPEYYVINNCEATFRLGHFLVFNPGKVEGDIRESYSWLSGETPSFAILNHPYLSSDRWREIFLPHVRGIEVINGAVLREALRCEDPFLPGFRLIDYPHVACYADYLEQGVEVYPFGASDAHALSEIGYGVTGIWSDENGVEESLKGGRIFAATDTGMVLSWGRGSETGKLTAHFYLESREDESLPMMIEWYRGSCLVKKERISAGEEESILLLSGDPGYLWFGIRRGNRFGISSARWVGTEEQRKEKQPLLSGLEREQFLLRRSSLPAPEELSRGELPEKWQIFAGDEPVRAFDAAGRAVSLIREPLCQDVIISRQADPASFEEFFLWLERNEIHEYRFCRIDYSIENGLLDFRGIVLPSLPLGRIAMDDRAPLIGEEIKKRWKEIRFTRVDLRVAARYSCGLTDPTVPPTLPLRLIDNGLGIDSHIGLFDEHRIIQIFTQE